MYVCDPKTIKQTNKGKQQTEKQAKLTKSPAAQPKHWQHRKRHETLSG